MSQDPTWVIHRNQNPKEFLSVLWAVLCVVFSQPSTPQPTSKQGSPTLATSRLVDFNSQNSPASIDLRLPHTTRHQYESHTHRTTQSTLKREVQHESAGEKEGVACGGDFPGWLRLCTEPRGEIPLHLRDGVYLLGPFTGRCCARVQALNQGKPYTTPLTKVNNYRHIIMPRHYNFEKPKFLQPPGISSRIPGWDPRIVLPVETFEYADMMLTWWLGEPFPANVPAWPAAVLTPSSVSSPASPAECPEHPPSGFSARQSLCHIHNEPLQLSPLEMTPARQWEREREGGRKRESGRERLREREGGRERVGERERGRER
ncbi:Genetic suppressor element 1, partial [Ophiophagus hannah]